MSEFGLRFCRAADVAYKLRFLEAVAAQERSAKPMHNTKAAKFKANGHNSRKDWAR